MFVSDNEQAFNCKVRISTIHMVNQNTLQSIFKQIYNVFVVNHVGYGFKIKHNCCRECMLHREQT